MARSLRKPKRGKGKAKKASSPPKKQNTRTGVVRTGARPLGAGRIGYEVRGIVTVGVAAVLGLALLSAGAESSGNWIGPFGDFFARVGFKTLGAGAYLVPAIVALYALPWLRGVSRVGVRWPRRIWGTVMFVAGCSLVSGAFSTLTLHGYDVEAGGMLGAFVHQGIASGLGELGARVSAGIALLVAMALFSGRSLFEALQLALARLRPAWQYLLDGIARLGGHFRAFSLSIPGRIRSAWDSMIAGIRDVDFHSGEYDEAEYSSEKLLPNKPSSSAPTITTPSIAALLVDIPAPRRAPVAAPAAAPAAAPVVAPVPTPFPQNLADEAEMELPSISVEGPPKSKTEIKTSPQEPPLSVDTDKPMVAERVVEEEIRHSSDRVRETPDFQLPSLELLHLPDKDSSSTEDEEELLKRAARLESALESYSVKGRIVGIHPGPVVTRFDFEPARGVKVARVMSLAEDLSLALASAGAVRVGGVIPGKSAIGIEVPNEKREIVYLREVVSSKAYNTDKYKLPAALGRDIEGRSVAVDMAKMPHVLVAGATGMGKSVTVNSILISLLLSRTPAELRLILIDPKMLEFRIYDDIGHLLVPVVTDPRKAATALRWAVNEMNRRYRVLSRVGVRSIEGFNKKVDEYTAHTLQYDDPDLVPTLDIDAENTQAPAAPLEEIFVDGQIIDDDGTDLGPVEHMPFILIVIDELADLMMVAKKEVEESVVRLAQMARAAGLHMLLATQRPSVDVITGLIKANMPSRLSCRVTSKTDSRTILDANGAEHLLGRGDMLYLSPGQHGLKRVHGCYVADDEVAKVTEYLRTQGEPNYERQVLAGGGEGSDLPGGAGPDEEVDEMYLQAVEIVVRTQRASASSLQTRMGIGYPKAARFVEQMEQDFIVGPHNGSKARKVLLKPHELEERYPGLVNR